MKKISPLPIFLALLFCCSFTAASGPAAMTIENLYFPCLSCHGEKGEGTEAINVPAIAGQQASYLQRQLFLYRDGGRGQPGDDVYGKQMALIAKTLTDDAWVNSLAEYVAQLPAQPLKQSILTPAYQGCAGCHGQQGEGKEEIHAPRLDILTPRYIARQLYLFRDGLRAYNDSDQQGKMMAQMVKHLSDRDIEVIAEAFQ